MGLLSGALSSASLEHALRQVISQPDLLPCRMGMVDVPWGWWQSLYPLEQLLTVAEKMGTDKISRARFQDQVLQPKEPLYLKSQGAMFLQRGKWGSKNRADSPCPEVEQQK